MCIYCEFGRKARLMIVAAYSMMAVCFLVVMIIEAASRIGDPICVENAALDEYAPLIILAA